MADPTIVLASLSDDKLKESINSLVKHVNDKMEEMVESTNSAVKRMEDKLKSLGNLKIDSGGSADGGASKRAKAQNAETDAVEKSIAARDKQIKKNQEAATSFDNFAKAQQVAIRSANPSGMRNAEELQTMNIQLDLLRERLREARQQYSSFVALAAHATTTGDKGLFQYATEGVYRYEQEVRNLIPQIRTLQSGIQQMGDVIAPQGHTIQNYVNSLQKANPELTRLNESFKRGQSLMQNGTITTQQLANAQGKLNTNTNQSKQTLDDMNAYIRQNIQREQERRDAIRQTGLAAQESLAKIKQNAQIELATNTGKTVNGVKELTSAIREMERAYFDMSSYDKESPIGRSLKADIEYAKKLRIAIDAYNRTIGGFSVIGGKSGKSSSLGAYTELSNILKTLTDEYKRLGREERNSAKGNDLADKIQRLSRATQKMQQQMNRPISFAAAMKGDEKTLDDIAYKMQRLRSYRQGIDLTKPNAANEIKQVDEALTKLQKDADKWMSKSQELIKNNTALGRSWNYMKNRLAFYFTVGASTQFIKNLIEVRSQYEMNERALGILINSAERGTQIFNELSQMALVSPYTLIELSTAAKQLTAYDVAAKDVVDTTRRLADMAAAVGIPIERLTYALGQIKAYGYLNSRDARMFANAGIPLVKQLSDYYTELEGRLVSTADVYDRIKKKAIDYNEVMEVINKMTDQGGKFFDFQAKMADTLKVRLANLTLAWNNMLNDMGKESQGVLTWGIGALRDLFLQWKQLDSLIKNAALAVGVRTLLIALRAATIGLGSFGKAMTWNAILGKKLGGVVVGLAKSFGTLFSSRLTWFALLAIAAVEATQAIFGVNEAQKALNESIRNGAKDNYNNISKFLEQYKEIRESLYATQKVAIGNIYNPVTRKVEASSYAEQQVGQDIDNNEAKKAWEAIREQIELTVVSSDKYIGNLLSISNMSERVRQGFNLLDDVQVVNAALKELDDDTIKVSKDLSAWWNAWQAPDGLIGNLKDYQETLNDIIAKYGTLESFRENTFLGGKGSDDLNDYETALERFRNDLQETTDSIINFIELKGWSGDESKINQVFEQITQKLVLDNQLDPQKAFTLQTEVEEARSKAAKEALLQRINDEKEAYKISHDEQLRQSINADVARYNSWNETNGRSKVEWERFTKWLKEQHISETTAMFRNMDAEDIKSLNFQEGKHAEWVTRMVTQYAKEHKMSYDEAFKYLKSWVRSANQWSIYIPLTISSEDKKSVYDQLGEYDKAIDDADAQITRLTTRINELNAKKKKSKEETQELANAEQELADAQKAKADAEAKGGHGKKEKKDEKAANKAAKQAESELAKALKDELSTIEKVRSIYKDLTKEGMSHANAVERATRGWDETVNAINRVLQKNGLQKLDLSKFAGIENPRELVNMLQSQLNTLLKRGAKPAEIKELQTKIQTLNVDADKYDLTKITKGLNNELGKLKDEYELAVELDANPELGNMFTEMFGIDTSEFPKTIDEYMQRVQNEFDNARKSLNLAAPLDIFKASDEDWYNWGKAVDYSEEQVDNFKKSFDGAVGVAKKWAQDTVKSIQDLEYKLGDLAKKIEIEEAKLAVLEDEAANNTNAAQKRLLELRIQEQKEAIEKLKMESIKLLPFYEDLFGDMYNVSVSRLKQIAKAAKEVMTPRKGENGVGYVQRTDSKGKVVYDIFAKDKQGEIKKTTVSLEEYIKINKQIDSVQQKIAESNPWEKIKDSFSKDENGKIKNFGSGMEAIGGELQKVAGIANAMGGFAQALGADEDTVELINDIGTAIEGVATVAQGIGQIAQGDILGGLLSVMSGLFSAIGSLFGDADKEIVDKIEKSERAVKRLENSYKNLEYAIERAYGMAEYGARRAAIANRQLQLVEMQRQLRLEQSRDSKHRDEDRILELKGQIIDLRNEISQSIDDITNDLLGITSVGNAAEELVSSMIDAFKKGEDYMLQYDESFEKMIDNMIMKAIVSRVVGDRIEEMWNQVKAVSEARGEDERKRIEELVKKQNEAEKRRDQYEVWAESDFRLGSLSPSVWKDAAKKANNEIERIKKALEQAEKDYAKAIEPTREDVDSVRNMAAGWREDVKNEFEYWMGAFGIGFGEDAENKQLSNLQQGIQGITEDTAGALEAITNGISQQCYLQSDILIQIRDTVQSFDIDIQTASLSQILLQLQSSYQLQQSMLLTMENWTNPSGNAVRVELIS